jgi:hypothetical protein
MTGVVAITCFALFVMACVGLLLSGIGAIRQARLAQRMFDMRFQQRRQESAEFSESN